MRSLLEMRIRNLVARSCFGNMAVALMNICCLTFFTTSSVGLGQVNGNGPAARIVVMHDAAPSDRPHDPASLVPEVLMRQLFENRRERFPVGAGSSMPCFDDSFPSLPGDETIRTNKGSLIPFAVECLSESGFKGAENNEVRWQFRSAAIDVFRVLAEEAASAFEDLRNLVERRGWEGRTSAVSALLNLGKMAYPGIMKIGLVDIKSEDTGTVRLGAALIGGSDPNSREGISALLTLFDSEKSLERGQAVLSTVAYGIQRYGVLATDDEIRSMIVRALETYDNHFDQPEWREDPRCAHAVVTLICIRAIRGPEKSANN